MRLLLDTCTLLWISGKPDRLPSQVVDLFRAPENEIFLSASSAWEIAIKYNAARLDLPEPPERFIPESTGIYGLTILAISLDHVLSAGKLPFHHHDPFDRLLIAQAQVEELTIATPDRAFAAYGIPLIW